MSSPPPPPASGIFDSLFSPSFQTWVRDMRQSAKEHSSSLTTEGYIRLIIIVGAYCMIRPYLLKLGGRAQAADHEREVGEREDDEGVSPAVVSPRELRLRGWGGGNGDGDGLGESSSEGEEGGESTGPRWGRGARRRQRQRQRRVAAQKVLEAEESKVNRKEEEADSDREIEEFLRKVID